MPTTEDHAGTQATERLLREFSDIICDEIPNDVVLDRKYKAKIQPKDNAVPVQSKPYPIPLALEDELKNNLQYLLERKIIEPSLVTELIERVGRKIMECQSLGLQKESPERINTCEQEKSEICEVQSCVPGSGQTLRRKH